VTIGPNARCDPGGGRVLEAAGTIVRTRRWLERRDKTRDAAMLAGLSGKRFGAVKTGGAGLSLQVIFYLRVREFVSIMARQTAVEGDVRHSRSGLGLPVLLKPAQDLGEIYLF